jgi:hypothetical protein
VFFPSFGYADQVQEHWRSTGMMDRLATRKRIFREPRDATQVEADLREYASHIAGAQGPAPGGAVLLCVVGAKMSEGINFGNDLARHATPCYLLLLTNAHTYQRVREREREREKERDGDAEKTERLVQRRQRGWGLYSICALLARLSR